jgi:hypothetical protein
MIRSRKQFNAHLLIKRNYELTEALEETFLFVRHNRFLKSKDKN